MTTALAVDTVEIDSEAKRLLSIANDCKITTQAQYEIAATVLREVKAFAKQVEDHFAPHIKRAHETHKALTTDKNNHLAPALKAESVLKGGMTKFLECEELKREQEQNAALAAAQIKAEEERKLELAALKASGAKAEAKALKAAPIIPAPVAIVAAPAKVAGVTIKKVFQYEIADPKQIKPEYLQPNEVLIKTLVQKLGFEAAKLIGGIVVKQVSQVGASAK